MKISINECNKAAGSAADVQEKILPKDMPRTRHAERATATNLSPLEQGILVAEEALKSIPDTRDEIVEDLKRRIQAGEYRVSGEDIADMMMRRRAADKVR